MSGDSISKKDIRSEQEIFHDLELLCASPGYAHAIAYFVWRDTTITYNKNVSVETVVELYTRNDIIIRSEMSMLIGLMCKASLDTNMPPPETLQGYIDKTELLLEELHQSMISLFPPKNSENNYFENGNVLREAIFYGGVSAYDFQYKDLSVKKYSKDNDWFEKKKGYSVEQASLVISSIFKIRNYKLNRLYNDFRLLPPDDWSLLPALMFSVEEVSQESCLSKVITQAVIDSFVSPKDMDNKKFCAVDDFNIMNAYPVIALEDNNYILFQNYSLVSAFYETPFFWFNDDSSYRDIAVKHRGDFTEEFTAERLKLVFGANRVYQNINIGSKKKKIGEIDILVVYGNRAIIVQAKSKKLTIAARKGNVQIIKDDFKKAIQDAYDQCVECTQLLCDASNKLFHADGSELHIPRDYKEIYPICIVSDYYPTLSIQSRQFLDYIKTEKIMPPFVIDIFFLDVMTEMLQTPLYFLSYLDRRAKYNEKLISLYELSILSYHLAVNLNFDDKEYSLVQIIDTCRIDVDVAMSVRREGVPGGATPEGILTKHKNTFWSKVIHDVEKIENNWSIELGLLFLTYSENNIDTINQEVKKISNLSMSDMSNHDISAFGDTNLPGLTIHCNTDSDDSAKELLENHCLARKYVCKAKKWLAVCIDPFSLDIRFGLFLDYKWEHDNTMDVLTQEMPSTHPYGN